MTKNRLMITPRDWISDYFSPLVTVLASPDAEAVVGKNNLTPVELLQPFSKLLSDLTIKDAEGNNHAIHNLNIIFQDFKKDPFRLVNHKLLSDLVASQTEDVMVSRNFPPGSSTPALEAPGQTPWFDTWTKLYIHSIGASEHEYVRHHIGCVFMVSTSHANVLDQFRQLTEQQYNHHHQKPNSFPQYILPNILKYYVLVHDVYDGIEESKAHELFTQIQNYYGSGICHFLQINSRNTANSGPSDVGDHTSPPSLEPSSTIVDHWLAHSHRFCNVEARLEGMGSTVINTAASIQNNSAPAGVSSSAKTSGGGSKSTTTTAGESIDHPLAMTGDEAGADERDIESPTPAILTSSSNSLKPVNAKNIGLHLSNNDIDRIRILVREFSIKGILPYVERQLRTLHDTVTNRKSRSLFSGAKRWFGQNKPGTAGSGTSVVYGKEAPELQMRKLADLYFVFRMYKNAYGHYHTLKKDFQSDEAWNYYAGSAEMASLSIFMQNDPVKKYPAHYIEDAITKYQQVCQMPEFAVRATLFDAMCLKSYSMFQEAATSYIRMTNDAKELRSSLLLEQAAYCFLLANPPSIRKYAFHIILSGYRFSKTGQNRHSSRTYRQGFQVYRDHGWSLSEDHILYTLGHQSLLLKDHKTAAALFNELLSMSKPNLNALQQMCHLREFFIVHHMREKETANAGCKIVSPITIPRFLVQDLVLDMSNDPSKTYDELKQMHPRESWKNLEKVIIERIHGQEVMFLSKTCQSIFSPVSNNNLVPQAVIGEQVQLLIPVKNDFQTTLVLKKIHLLWKFSSDEQADPIDNKSENAASFIQTNVVDSITVEKNSKINIMLGFTVLQPGDLYITGVEYGIKAQFPQTESTDYTIRGKQSFEVRGPRLKSTKEHKTSVVYGKDNRLQLAVRDQQPRLNMSLEMPETLFQGELRCLDLFLTNCGSVPINRLYLISHSPGLISFGKQPDQPAGPKSVFDFPVITDSSLSEVAENGSSVEKPLDYLPIPLENGKSLAPGASAKIAIWIRGPEHLGANDVKIGCYYEKETSETLTKKRSYRILCKDYKLRVLPSVTVSATRSDTCVFDSQVSEMITVHISNISKESTSSKSPLEEIFITQVSLVSHDTQLQRFQSKNESSLAVSRLDSSSVNLKAVKPPQEKKVKDNKPNFGTLMFSSVKSNNSAKGSFSIQSAPFVDFLKPGFSFTDLKASPKLQEDLVVVFWRGGGGASSANPHITGQLIVPLKQAKVIPGSNDTDSTDGGSRSEPQQIGATAPKVAMPVLVKFEAQDSEYSFGTGRICTVPCKLVITNPNSVAGKFCSRVDEFSVPSFLGCVNSDVIVEAHQTLELEFMVAVTELGLFQCKGLQFQMISPTGTEDDLKRAGLIPIDISFVVGR